MAILQVTEVIVTDVDTSQLVFANISCAGKEFEDVCLGKAYEFTADSPDVEFPEDDDDMDGYHAAMDEYNEAFIAMVQAAIEGKVFVYDEDEKDCHLADAS